jgi:hypothetical protein
MTGSSLDLPWPEECCSLWGAPASLAEAGARAPATSAGPDGPAPSTVSRSSSRATQHCRRWCRCPLEASFVVDIAALTAGKRRGSPYPSAGERCSATGLFSVGMSCRDCGRRLASPPRLLASSPPRLLALYPNNPTPPHTPSGTATATATAALPEHLAQVIARRGPRPRPLPRSLAFDLREPWLLNALP